MNNTNICNYLRLLWILRARLKVSRGGSLPRGSAIPRNLPAVSALALFFLSNFAAVSPMMAQGPTPVPPDCVIFINNWTVNQSSASFANYYNGCVAWTMTVNPAATVTGLSVRFESAVSATNTPAPGTPGVFGAYAGTVDTGLNPIVSTAGGVTTFSNGTVEIPWVRVTMTGYMGSGAVNGVVYGYKAGYPGAGTVVVVGACPNPCPVVNGPTPFSVQGETASGSPPTTPPVLGAGFDGTNIRTIKTDTSGNQFVDGPAAVGAAAPNPLTTGYRDSSGNVLADYGFPSQAQITLVTGTDVVVVAGVAATNTYVGHLSFAADSGQTVTIQQGTGSACGTNTVVLAGPYQLTTALALDFDVTKALHTTVAARDLCLHFGGSVTAGGVVVYGTH